MEKIHISNQRDYESIAKKLALEAVFGDLPINFFWMDRNGILQGCNENLIRLFRLASVEEYIGKHIRYFSREESWKNCEQVMISGKTETFEEIHETETDKIFFLSVKAPLFDKNDQIIGLIGVSIDITAQKKIEEKLHEAEHKFEGMGLVSASIAHETRTPLSSILLGVNTLSKKLPELFEGYKLAITHQLLPKGMSSKDVNDLQEVITTLKEEVRAALTFLDMQLIKNNFSIKATPKEVFFISHCIHDALTRYPYNGDDKQLIEYDLVQDFEVKGEKLLLVHVLFNLMKNAFHYIEAAQKGKIFIWLERGKFVNTLYFKDTGQGISAEYLPHIFEQFFSKTYHGSGVGLTFCKKVMTDLGGNIICESNEKEYTQFSLTFPVISPE